MGLPRIVKPNFFGSQSHNAVYYAFLLLLSLLSSQESSNLATFPFFFVAPEWTVLLLAFSIAASCTDWQIFSSFFQMYLTVDNMELMAKSTIIHV